LISKMGAVGAVTLGLLWSLWSVQGIVHERQGRQQEAEQSVANSLAGSQTLLGPVLTRTCIETWVTVQEDDKGHRRATSETETHVLRLPATQVQVDAEVGVTPRHRGMFTVNGYGVKAGVQARWADLGGLTLLPRQPGAEVRCEAPVLAVSVSDARGIRVAELRVNDQRVTVQAGSEQAHHARGFHAPLEGVQPAAGTGLSVRLNLELAGTRGFSMAPVADTTLVRLRGDWPHPSFGGRFLPSERVVRADGFDATWKVSSLASTASQSWRGGERLCAASGSGAPFNPYSTAEGVEEAASAENGCIETFGVSFIDPVNVHSLSDRATKYGLLFIVLTFVGVGLMEVLRRLRVHPIQYLLVGAALSLFFLLLVSLSEHLAFGWAYLAASAACTLLLTFYGSFVLRGWGAGLGFGVAIGGLYGVLYALLQMEQNALVLGSLLLFAVLSAVMVATRQLDWYELLGQGAQRP
jgi:inner membrane protein